MIPGASETPRYQTLKFTTSFFLVGYNVQAKFCMICGTAIERLTFEG